MYLKCITEPAIRKDVASLLEATFFYLENSLVLFLKEILLHQCSTSLPKEWTVGESGLHGCALSSIPFHSVMLNTA